jgi:hypothetical protein
MRWSTKEQPVVRRLLRSLRELAAAHDDGVAPEHRLAPLLEDYAESVGIALDIQLETRDGKRKRKRTRVFGANRRKPDDGGKRNP